MIDNRILCQDIMTDKEKNFFMKYALKQLKKKDKPIIKSHKCLYCKHCYELEHFYGECWECEFNPVKDKNDIWHKENEINRRKVAHWRKCEKFEKM